MKKIVIELDNNEYIRIKECPNNITSYPVTIHLYDAVRNGIPLEEEFEKIKKNLNEEGNKK